MTKTCLCWEMCKAVKLTEDPISGKKLHFHEEKKNYLRKLKLFSLFTAAAVSNIYFPTELNLSDQDSTDILEWQKDKYSW